jgi:hypothetical protein
MKQQQSMKLSVEMKVAAAVAAAFIGLTAGAIAQVGSDGRTGGPNRDPAVNTHMIQKGYDSSLTERTNAEENR